MAHAPTIDFRENEGHDIIRSKNPRKRKYGCDQRQLDTKENPSERAILPTFA